jgi:hypothetical protein
MLWLALTLQLLGKPQYCNSTIFGTPEDYATGSAGTVARYLRRPVDEVNDIGIAHRTLPLGSLVYITVPKLKTQAIAVVIDRGPYGRRAKDGSWYNGAAEWRAGRKYSPGSRWNGCADLSPELARILQHDGWEKVKLWPIRWLRVRREVLLKAWGGGTS